MAQFNTFRLTPHGRARLATISQSVDDYLSENEFLNLIIGEPQPESQALALRKV